MTPSSVGILKIHTLELLSELLNTIQNLALQKGFCRTLLRINAHVSWTTVRDQTS